MTRLLAHDRLTGGTKQPAHWLIFLHGMFGWGKNWMGIARRVIDARPDWGAVLVDLPEHGDSQSMAGEPDIEHAAAHLARLVEHLGISSHAVLGHSFGGKVALQYARDFPQRLRQTWVIDSTPAAVVVEGEAAQMLRLLQRMSRQFVSRDEGLQQLLDRGVERNVAKWMAMNLVPQGKLFGWRMSLETMDRLLADFQQRDLWPVVKETELPLHFVRGTRSPILSPEAVERIEAAGRMVHLHDLDAGHWVHVDRPVELTELIAQHLPT